MAAISWSVPGKARRRSCWRRRGGRWARRGRVGWRGSTPCGGRVEVKDHHHVAVNSVDALGAQAVGGVLDLEGAPIRGTDHQDVLGAGVVTLHRSGGQVLQVDAVDLMVEVPGVPSGRPGDQHENQRQGAPHPGRRALAGTTFRGSVCRALPSIVPFGAPALAASASAGVGSLVDLASELMEALLDGVLGRILCGARLCRPLADLLTQLVEALLDGIVLGLGRTHRAVFRLKTCDRTLRSTPVPPR